MNGGTIANNTATKYGGGVYCEASKRYGSEDTAKINLNGGTITGNTAGIAGGGVYFGGMTTCKVAGTVNITGNTQGDDKAASNLHVAASGGGSGRPCRQCFLRLPHRPQRRSDPRLSHRAGLLRYQCVHQ